MSSLPACGLIQRLSSTPPGPASARERAYMVFAYTVACGECRPGFSGRLEIFRDWARLRPFGISSRGVRSGPLTDAGQERTYSLYSRLENARLLAHYPGCGVSCDGAEIALSLGYPDLAPQIAYTSDRLERLPPALRDADRFLRGLWVALRACRATGDIRPTKSCSPLRRPA